MALLPRAMYGLEVPPGDIAIPANDEVPAAFRVTMAAIDPSAEPEGEEGAVPRATLKIIRQPLFDDDEEDDDFDADELDRILAEGSDDERDDDEGINGGPSDLGKSKKAKREAARAEIKKMLEDEGMDVDGEVNGVNGTAKSPKARGKMPRDEDAETDDDESIESDEGEVEEFVLCTLDPNKNYQQSLDITFGEDEQVFFKVTGTHSIYLTGNYVEPVGDSGMFDPNSDEEDEYDLEPDDDELDASDDESMDELDELEDPRVEELEDDEDVPALVAARDKKSATKPAAASKSKRPAPDSADEEDAETLDEMIKKESQASQPTTNGEQKLSKKQLKKLKKNDGAAAAAPAAVDKVAKADSEATSSSAKSDKKVSFAKELEQGPTPTKGGAADTQATDGEKPKGKSSLGVKIVQGVTVDDRKLGSGQAAKRGDRLGMRYIGKLQADNKVFDSNKRGKPFTFKLGIGEVIKGWDIGILGMQVGGERRLIIPPHLAYGSKRMPDIPPNSTLIFDIKLMEIHK